MVDRMGPLRAPLGQWIEGRNGGAISSGALIASGADIGVEGARIEQLAGAPSVAGDGMSVVVPAGARSIKIDFVAPSDLLVLVPGRSMDPGAGNDVVYDPGGGNDVVDAAYATDATTFFPGGGRAIKIADMGEPTTEDVLAWLTPGSKPVGEFSMEDATVVAFTGEQSPADLFGDESESAFRRVEPGEAFQKGNTLFVMPGDRVIGKDEKSLQPERLFDAGIAAPLSGATFTMTVLSTPDASVLGQSANPLVDMDTDAILERDETQQLLKRAGVTDADAVKWLAGPVQIDAGGSESVSVFGKEAESGIETYGAVVSGADGPWQIVAHVVRVTTEDHVLVVGVHRRPVGTPNGGEMDEPATLADTRAVENGRELMRAAVERLQAGSK